jgi:hypothetical protein
MEDEDDLYGERQRGGRGQEGRVSRDTRLRLHSVIAHIQHNTCQLYQHGIDISHGMLVDFY